MFSGVTLSSLLQHALFGMVDTVHVLAGQSGAAEGLLGVLAVTLEDFGLQICTDWMIFIPFELGFHLFSSFLILLGGDFVEL